MVEKLNKLGGKIPASLPPPAPAQAQQRAAGGAIFKEILRDKQASAAAPPTAPLKFSGHAQDRMRTRSISFSPQEMKMVEQAVDKAASKGARESLLLINNKALVVSVRNRTVITAVDEASLKENVFTNIDSAVIL